MRLAVPPRSALDAVADVAARVGTVVTLAALLVVGGTVLGAVGATPAPAGSAVQSR
jgi:hypothetical protein